MAHNLDHVRYDVGDEVCFRSPSWFNESKPIKHVVLATKLCNNEAGDGELIKPSQIIEYQLVEISDYGWIPAMQLFPWNDDMRQQLLAIEANSKRNRRATTDLTKVRNKTSKAPKHGAIVPSGNILAATLNNSNKKNV